MLSFNRLCEFVLTLVLASVVLLSGASCGFLISGSEHSYNVDSTPSGAEVTIYVAQRGLIGRRYYGNERLIADQFTTPGSTRIQMDSEYVVEFKLAGYKTIRTDIPKEFNTWSVLNLTSIACWIVDILTGAVYTPANDGRLHVRLVAGGDGVVTARDRNALNLVLSIEKAGRNYRLGTLPLERGEGVVHHRFAPPGSQN